MAARTGSTPSPFDLSESELLVLTEACRTLDEIEQLRAAVERDGVTTLGSAGQPRGHPLLVELRGHRTTLGRLLGQLALPGLDDDSTLPTPRQVRSRRGTAARWGGDRRGAA